MNAIFSDTLRWFRGRWRAGSWALFALLAAPWAARGTDSFFINSGYLVTPPAVDATNFVNYGTFNIASLVSLFTTSGTLNFTNMPNPPGAGFMTNLPGWQFNWEPVNGGLPRPADNFYNDGRIAAGDYYLGGGLGGSIPVQSLLLPSKLFVTATNIISHGALTVGANGWLRLTGSNVDLSSGVLEVVPTADEVYGSLNNSPAGFFSPDTGVSDYYWGGTNTGFGFNSGSLWNGFSAQTPLHPVTAVVGGGTISFPLPNPYADSYIYYEQVDVQLTNSQGQPGDIVVLFSNEVKQAVFVEAPANMSVSLGFTPSPVFNNHFQRIGVLLQAQSSNVVTTLPENSYLFMWDELGSEPGRGFLRNVVTPATMRPTNYLVSRLLQSVGGPGNFGYPEPNFFTDTGSGYYFGGNDIESDSVTNANVNGPFSAYSAYVDNLVVPPATIETGSVTNLPGRVHINAENLNLSKTRIRGEGEVIIQTPHLVSSKSAIIDCENLSYDLGSTNGNLKIQSLAADGVSRLRGHIYAWSALWSNTVVVVITNNFVTGTNDQGVLTNAPAPITNNLSVSYHTLMLDASQLQTALPVKVYDFTTHSTNVVVDDNLTCVEKLLIGGDNGNGRSLTLNGNVALSSSTINNAYGPAVTVSVPNWTHTNAPNLLYFTNNGTFSVVAVPGEAHFGDDAPNPYVDFINNGTIAAESIAVDSDYIENNGTLTAAGPLFLEGNNARLQNGSSTASGVTSFALANLKLYNYQVTANGTLNFNIANALFDAGPDSGNVFALQDGFNLWTYPASSSRGDLLGTTFQSTVPNVINPVSATVEHYWAARDLGPAAAGYLNNEAIGNLTLDTRVPDPTFFFSGTSATGTNGLYVDMLDLSALGTNYARDIIINPNLVIYYASAKLGFTPPADTNQVAQEPEEYLDGQFGGHLRWVPSFAGPNSYADVVIVKCNGQQLSIKVNAALRDSLRIDSDGDGLVNGMDPYPFNTNPNGDPLSAPVPCTIGLDTNLQALASHAFVFITAPASGQSVLIPSAVVQGTAGGQSGQARVYFQVNGSGWTPAASANGGANWSGSVNLSAGLNVVQAYAIDSSGQQSATQSVDVTYVPSAQLGLAINGVGIVSPYTNGQWLTLSNTYTLTAYPGAGYTFSNWTGDVFPPSSSPQLTFLMKSNLSLTANFIPPVYSPEPATYSGLFYESNQVVNFGESGGITIMTSSKGSYSGKLLLGGQRFALHGKFGTYGSASVTNRIRGGGQLIVHLQMNTSDDSRITGTVSNGAWVADFEALRSVDAFAGTYTLVIPGSDDVADTGEPYGDGYAAITVKRGKVRIKGVLADGTRITGSTTVSQDGRCPLDVALYHGNGQILGWLTFTNLPQPGLSGWLNWHKEPAVPRTLYPDGFDLEITNVTGSAYDPSARPVTRFTAGTVVFSGGDLPADITNSVSIDARNKVNDLTVTNSLKLKLKKSQGLFSGKLADPSNPKKALRFGGVILQGPNTGSGYGYFLGAGQSGKVILGP